MKKHTQSNTYEAAIIFTASKMGYDAKEAGLDWDATSEFIARKIQIGKFHSTCAIIQKQLEKQ